MKNRKNTTQNFVLIALGVLATVLLIRYIPILFRFLPWIVLLGGIVWGGLALIDYLSKAQQRKEYANSTEGIVSKKLKHCQQSISSIQKEKLAIEQDIQDLESQLSASRHISSPTLEETQRIIKEFRKELDLRNTKIEFYQTCINKLQALLHNHQLAKELEIKQQTLRQLREKNQEDIVDFEELKSSLAFEQSYISTIDELSYRMLESSSLQDAQAVQLELETITQELRKL